MPQEIARRYLNGEWNTGASESEGGAFNGGQITSPLVIDVPQGSPDVPLTVVANEEASGQEVATFTNAVTGGAVTVDDDATIQMTGRTDGSSDPWLRLRKSPSGVNVIQLKSDGARRIEVAQDDGTLRFVVTSGGYILIKVNAAPADGVLAANDLALWFDSSNGAAKLMLKGKTADGTVVTGQVALT